MKKKIISAVLALLIICVPAMAEVFTGTTVARSTMAITADAGGILNELYIQPGSVVKEGEVIARLRTAKVFATQNGTIARIHAEEGKKIEGTVLEIAPVSRYTIHCTSDEAYDSISSNLVHCGETLYMKCTTNGTHQGSGRVYSIDGSAYMVEAIGGEFYVGETVCLYRDAQYAYKQLVGTGTVVPGTTEAYESEGKITAIHVSEGEYVEKGELLYEVIDGEGIEIVAPADGIIKACEISEGSFLNKAQPVAQLVPYADICISFQADEIQLVRLSVGDQVFVSYAYDTEEKHSSGEIISIAHIAENNTYSVWVAPDTHLGYIGMNVQIQTR